MTFIIWHYNWQFHCKSEHKQVKWDEIKQNMCKFDSIFRCLQLSTLFKFISWQGLSQKWMITAPKEKSPSFNFISQNLKEIGRREKLVEKNSRPESKITTIFRLSWKYFNCIVIKIFKKICFAFNIKMMLYYLKFYLKQ